MLELIVEVCLAARGDLCADRLLPGACIEARAETWVAARPELTLAGWRCGGVAPLAVVEIAPGVFVHEGAVATLDRANLGDHANVGFIIGSEAVAVIDTGGTRHVAEGLYAAVRERTDLPIGWLILTHTHPDHVMGGAVFDEAGAVVIGHARLGPALEARADTYVAAMDRLAGPAAGIGGGLVLPEEAVDGRREIDLGGRLLTLEAHPTAHTDNDLTVFDETTGTWWLSDLIFASHLPVVDGSVLGWIDLLDALALRPASRVVPGHGAVSQPWPAAAGPTRDYLARLVAETRDALARGEPLSVAGARVGADLRGAWELFDDFNARNATTVYRELEWE